MKSDKKYQFWLEAGGKRIQLPVNPETVKISRSGNNSSMTIIGLGEITNIQEPKSAVISFSGIFPKAYFPGCAVKKLLLPHYYITVITNWQKEKLPVRIYITACDIVWYTTIESFSYSQSGGDVGSYDYSLTLKQYQMIRVRRININKNKTAQTQKKKSSRPRIRGRISCFREESCRRSKEHDAVFTYFRRSKSPTGIRNKTRLKKAGTFPAHPSPRG